MTDIDTKQDVFWVPESQCRIVEDERDRLKAETERLENDLVIFKAEFRKAREELDIWRSAVFNRLEPK